MHDLFTPTWRRALLAGLLAATAFFFPQEAPLQFYPYQGSGHDTLYLEITCASDRPGDIRIFYDTGQGFCDLESIRWPVSATVQTFTYTFPLPDAPIRALRISPIGNGATLTVRQLRVVNGRGQEMRRFVRTMFTASSGMASIAPARDGWTLTSAAGSNEPDVRIAVSTPLAASGYVGRNFIRCLVSTGYVAGMLAILLLALHFAAGRPSGEPRLLPRFGFIAYLALIFAVVGNRGLIRTSVHWAGLKPPVLGSSGLTLELDLQVPDPPPAAQLSWDADGRSLEHNGVQCPYEPHSGLQTLSFDLPHRPIRRLRFHPANGTTSVEVSGLRLVDLAHRTVGYLPPGSLAPSREIRSVSVDPDRITVHIEPGASDPILEFSPAAVASIDQALLRTGEIDSP